MVGDGSVRPVGLGPGAELVFATGNAYPGSEWGGGKVVWAVAPGFGEPVVITGYRLDGPDLIRFGQDTMPAPQLDLAAAPAGSTDTPNLQGWRSFPSAIRLQHEGCYAFQIDTPSDTSTIVFTARRSTPPTASAVGATSSTVGPRPKSEQCETTPVTTSSAGVEVHGSSSDTSVFGLLFTATIRQGDEVKIVWRMTGQGPLAVSSTAPDGTSRTLVWGPEPHSASSYARPGDEWGTGFRFDQAGCWHIHLQRTIGAGDVWLTVTP